ncbi:MAG: hypothetical protein ACPGID_11980 [Rubricella sp.]
MNLFTFDGAAVAPRPDETLVDYWLSFLPVAPIMGLEYRPAKIWNFGFAEEIEATPAASRVQEPVEEAEVVAAPAAVAPAATAAESDLTKIKGIGAKLQAELNELGLYTIAQLAEYTEADIARISDAMTAFKDRPVRDDWVGQAKALLG